jgi:hypothetical protein
MLAIRDVTGLNPLRKCCEFRDQLSRVEEQHLVLNVDGAIAHILGPDGGSTS